MSLVDAVWFGICSFKIDLQTEYSQKYFMNKYLDLYEKHSE